MPDNFFTKCLPLIRKDFSKCSGLTDCNLSPTTSTDLNSIYVDPQGRFRIMGSLLESDFMGKACQVQENALYDFIMQNAKAWGTAGKINVRRKINSGLVDIEPFILVGRKSFINNNYWQMSNGNTTPGTSPGGFAYVLKIDAASMTSIPLDQGWFPSKQPVFISSKSSTGLANLTQWTVVDSVINGAVITLYLTSANAGSRLPASKTETPTSGVGMLGVPNVSPWERYCAQVPRLNTNSDYPVFLQNTRWSICIDELTQKFMQHLWDDNPLYAAYYGVEEADYNRQVLEDFQRRTVISFLFNTPLAHQTVDDWANLDQITSWTDSGTAGSGIYLPGVEGRCVARRANAEGVYSQLYECGRVKDLTGDRLNWPELQAELYNMVRIRKSNGLPSDIIEIVVDSAFRVLFIQALVRYQQAKYDGAARYNIEVKDTKTNAGFVFTDFILDYPAGVTFRVVSHYALDDFLTAHTTVSSGLSNVGRRAWIFDWNTIYMAILESRSVTRETGNAADIAKVNEDALCVIDIPVKSVKLNTMLYTVVVDCPKASLWIENFAFQVPEHETPVGNYTDLYGDYAGNNAAFP